MFFSSGVSGSGGTPPSHASPPARRRGFAGGGATVVKLGNFGDARSVGDGVHELRVHAGPDYRVYFGREGDAVVILLCGGDKGSQERDIERARDYWRDHRSRVDE